MNTYHGAGGAKHKNYVSTLTQLIFYLGGEQYVK